jgi:hypothetical protein
MAKFAVTELSFTTVIPLTVMPEPAVIDVVPVRAEPLIVTGTLAPWVPLFGEIEVIPGLALMLGEFWHEVPVELPVSQMVTRATAGPVGVPVPGTHWTLTVQLLPGLTATPEAHVPPVTDQVPLPAWSLTVGALVSVSGPAVAPVAELLTVTVPILLPAGDELGVVADTAKLGVPAVTVNETGLLGLPLPFATVIFRAPIAAVPPMVKVVLI